ncbi:MAG TPA: ABC transporter permease, partial [Gemmatimonadaceae bacterium]|nr:ABC transporter permease [Gemmatimonadaceae bacterium]
MLGCVMLFGLAPAFRATRVDLATALRAHGRSLSGSATRLGRIPVAKLLVVAQVALSTLLLIGSGLLVRSMQRLMHADLGFDRDHVVGVHVAASRTNYMGARLAVLRRDLAERAARVPGVDAAAYTMEGVFSGGQSGGHVSVAGFVAQADSERQVRYDMVGPGYFRALRAHILRGRDFEPSDIATGANVAAVNETMANYYFRGRSAIGGIVTLDSVAYTVVGVVRDVQERSVRGKPVRRLYMATFDSTPKPQSFELVVHVGGDPSRFVAPLRQALLSADHTLPLEIEPLADRVRDSVREDRLLMQVTAFFGVVTLVLAALGLYGVTAYATSQRTSEFGLRIALGAEPGVIGRMVVREAVGLVVAGIVLGVPAGIAATRLIRERTFGVGAVDVPSLSAALVVLIVTALIASWIPAMRASRVGPLEALATET